MKTKKYDFYADQSHGWLKVPRAELIKLNILNKISGFSYQRKYCVYLEEDSDASFFIHAMREQGVIVQLREHYSNKESRIRTYNHFEI